MLPLHGAIASPWHTHGGWNTLAQKRAIVATVANAASELDADQTRSLRAICSKRGPRVTEAQWRRLDHLSSSVSGAAGEPCTRPEALDALSQYAPGWNELDRREFIPRPPSQGVSNSSSPVWSAHVAAAWHPATMRVYR